MNKKKGLRFTVIFLFSILALAFFCLVLLFVTRGMIKALNNGTDISNLINIQVIIIFVILAILLAVGIFNYFLVVSPLSHISKDLREYRLITLRGAEELRDISRILNRHYASRAEESNKLSYEASHDDLTGLFNRKVFDAIRENGMSSPYTVILMDVDMFKDINDKYGHELGDRILRKVGEVLKESFRESDYCCRIGGDEFAVIVIRTDESFKDIIKGKMEDIKRNMADTSDGLPAVTLSFGAAFSDGKEDVYKEADEALYTSKNDASIDMTFHEKTSG